MRAVPRQSLRERSKWESAPGPSDAGLAGDAAKLRLCDASENTVEKIKAMSKRAIGTLVRRRRREKAEIGIGGFSFQLIWTPENLLWIYYTLPRVNNRRNTCVFGNEFVKI